MYQYYRIHIVIILSGLIRQYLFVSLTPTWHLVQQSEIFPQCGGQVLQNSMTQQKHIARAGLPDQTIPTVRNTV